MPLNFQQYVNIFITKYLCLEMFPVILWHFLVIMLNTRQRSELVNSLCLYMLPTPRFSRRIGLVLDLFRGKPSAVAGYSFLGFMWVIVYNRLTS